jgi:hypothetical protein
MRTRPIGFVWLAGALCLACGNGHSPTEATKSAPVISNLSNPAIATVLPGSTIQGRRPGVLPITFSFTDPNGDVNQVIVTFPDGAAHNQLQGLAGRTAGTAGLQQDLLLPASGTRVGFSIQVVDALGQSSNTLTSTYTSP